MGVPTFQKNQSGTMIRTSRMQDRISEYDDLLVINKDQDIIDRKSYKADDTFERKLADEGYAGTASGDHSSKDRTRTIQYRGAHRNRRGAHQRMDTFRVQCSPDHHHSNLRTGTAEGGRQDQSASKGAFYK